MKIRRTLPRIHIIHAISLVFNRQIFQMKFDVDISEVYLAEAGVPQVSVLGPVLFIIYTHDFPVKTITSRSK